MRRVSTYTNAEKKELQRESEQLLKEIEFNDRKGINVLYKEQETCGARVADIFASDLSKVNILVCGKTQTGKTGCMLAVIKSILANGLLPVNNIFIITGLSSIDWINDTIARMPYALRNNIFHRGNLKKMIPLLKNKKNCLILIDEIQLGGEATHTVSAVFKKVGLYDAKYLFNNNIKIVQFTATPDGHIYDILDWQHMSAVIKLEPGRGYVSATDLFNSGRVKQYKSLTDVKAIMEIKTIIYGRYRYGTDDDSPRYHTIRIPSSKGDLDRKIINSFKNVFGDNFRYEEKFIEKKKDNINTMLAIEPFMHTFIFIKDILRCAKTKNKRFLGVEYERYAINPYDSTIIQGSIGRLTGYDDNGDSVCFTNIESIEKYQKLWDDNFDNISIQWRSATTNEGKRNSKMTYNSIKMYKNMEVKAMVREWGTITIIRDVVYDVKDFEEKKSSVRIYNNTIINSIPHPRFKKNSEGFYKCSAGVVSQVYSKKELLERINTKGTDGLTGMFNNNRHEGWKKGDLIRCRTYICYGDKKINTNPCLWLKVWHANADQEPFNMYSEGKTKTPEFETWLQRYGAIVK